jgi:hypothetical protein
MGYELFESMSREPCIALAEDRQEKKNQGRFTSSYGNQLVRSYVLVMKHLGVDVAPP